MENNERYLLAIVLRPKLPSQRIQYCHRLMSVDIRIIELTIDTNLQLLDFDS